MSLAIFIRATASPRRAAIAATIASSDPWRRTCSAPSRTGSRVSSAIFAAICVAEAGWRVEPRARPRCRRRPGDRARSAPAHVLERVAQLRRPARPLVADRQGNGVLEVRAADLHDVLPQASRLLLDGAREPLDLGQEVPLDLEHGGDVHRGREGVVRRLRHVDVVVRVNRRLAPELAAEQLDRAVRDDLVHVHVRLGARARLPYVERELAVELPRDHLVGRGADRRRPSTPAAGPPAALISAAAFLT